MQRCEEQTRGCSMCVAEDEEPKVTGGTGVQKPGAGGARCGHRPKGARPASTQRFPRPADPLETHRLQ